MRPSEGAVRGVREHAPVQSEEEVAARRRQDDLERRQEVRGEDGNTILLRVAVNKDELPHLHDQTTVTAKLYCGRRSLGFVWFCDLIETVQGKVLFWL